MKRAVPSMRISVRVHKLGVMTLVAAATSISLAQSVVTPGNGVYRDPLVEAREMSAYVDRLQHAANVGNFTGTFTVMTSGAMSTSRISHYVLGGEVYEQIELLDGARRTQLRHNNSVHTLMPEQRIATVENRTMNDGFPKLLKGDGEALAQLYELSYQGSDRVAGYASKVALLKARDNLRFGQRLWTDEKSGLLLKSQVIGPTGEVLEQVAFSEVNVNLPPTPERVKHAFKQTLKRVQDLRLMTLLTKPSTAQIEGWRLSSPVAGFREIACFKRGMGEMSSQGKGAASAAPTRDVLQWVFSDGIANVSVFAERYQPEFHGRETMMSMGATHTLTRRIVARGSNANGMNSDGMWWITVLGEVPPATLQAFAAALERIR